MRLALLTIIALLAVVPSASAQAPSEPNDTAATAAGPLVVTELTAALESEQDDDWYLLHAAAARDVSIVGTIGGSCREAFGQISVELHDADAPFATAAKETLLLGYDPAQSTSGPVKTAQLTFDSIVGHRYFVHVTHTACENVPYGLAISPGDAFGARLKTTKECSDAKRAVKRAKRKSKRRQAKQRARTRCARRPLVGSAWD